MTNTKWRDTLFVWDGILTHEKDAKVMKWEGTWVGCKDSPEAIKIEAPKRGAFDEFVTSEMKFTVQGKIDSSSGDKHIVSMVDGEGYDLGEGDEKKRHQDDAHEIVMTDLKWTGNLNDQRNNLVFASGKNEFGAFVSVGWMRPGCRLTLGRRYLDDTDPRASWTAEELNKHVLEHIYDDKDNTLQIPPWQCEVFNTEYVESTKKRPREEEGDSVEKDEAPEATKAKTDA